MPYGLLTPASWVAMFTKRWMHITGVTKDALYEVAKATRDYGANNPAAAFYGKTFDRGGRQRSAPKGRDARDAGPTKRRLQPWEIRKPIIAAINGAAVGVGLTIPLQYDMRHAAQGSVPWWPAR